MAKQYYKPGDYVVRHMSDEAAAGCRARKDGKEALKDQPYAGPAAAYMESGKAYFVESITETGSLRLKGFPLAVAQRHVRLAPFYRVWGGQNDRHSE